MQMLKNGSKRSVIKLNQNLKRELFEKQVSIERVKLRIEHFIFSSISAVFAIMTWLSLVVIHILGSWAGDSIKLKVIGIMASILYFLITLGLTMLFMDFAFYSSDDWLLVGYDYELHCGIRKYRSEIRAERKLKEKGLI